MTVQHRHQHGVHDSKGNDGEEQRVGNVISKIINGDSRGQRRVRLLPFDHLRLASFQGALKGALKAPCDLSRDGAVNEHETDIW